MDACRLHFAVNAQSDEDGQGRGGGGVGGGVWWGLVGCGMERSLSGSEREMPGLVEAERSTLGVSWVCCGCVESGGCGVKRLGCVLGVLCSRRECVGSGWNVLRVVEVE
jgi:hypothetical protein